MNGKKTQKKEVDTSKDTPLMSLFRTYSKKLNLKNDKHERIYKTNRDLTIKSKRIIFSLQRLPSVDNEEKEKLLLAASHDLKDIEQTLIKNIAMELQDEEQYQFLNAFTGGIQEYIEAVTFHSFLERNRIATHSLIQDTTTFGNSNDDVIPLSVLITPHDYLLGLSDLTGELMRYCIRSESIADYEMCTNICYILKEIHLHFMSLGFINSKDLYHKYVVLQSSLKKCEDVCYSVELKNRELPEKVHLVFPSALDCLIIEDEQI